MYLIVIINSSSSDKIIVVQVYSSTRTHYKVKVCDSIKKYLST